jgi:hypothetical protein
MKWVIVNIGSNPVQIHFIPDYMIIKPYLLLKEGKTGFAN